MKCECGGKLVSFEKIPISLPTPISEVRIGGKNPPYSTGAELPLMYCEQCGRVYKKPEEEEH